MTTTSTERVRAMRERRRQAVEAGTAAEVALRPADELLAPAVEETLAALDLSESDGAAAQLARQYARIIDQARDQAWAARWLSPLLLDCLVQLGATPASRPKREPPRAPNQLDRLRAARRPG
jgi:hypothetical protein